MSSLSQLAVDVGRILLLLARSPVGPVLMKDFRREQFVIVDGSLKLSDVDDVVVGDPQCTTAKDCMMQDSSKETTLASGENAALPSCICCPVTATVMPF